jgi:hypothetical protein
MPINGRFFMDGFLSWRWRQRNPFVDRPASDPFQGVRGLLSPWGGGQIKARHIIAAFGGLLGDSGRVAMSAGDGHPRTGRETGDIPDSSIDNQG